MFRFILIFSVVLFSFSCNDTEKPSPSTGGIEKPTSQGSTSSPTVPTSIKAKGKVLYPSIPFEVVKALYDRCDYVDYSFETLPMSLNRQEPSDIRHSLAQISNEPALIDESCPPLARMLYYKDGEIALEAMIYFSPGCAYFVFLENNQPKYANFMTPSGVNFFTDITTKLIKK